jgi:hypothetical protein
MLGTRFVGKFNFFYDLGCEKGTAGDMMGRSKYVFLEGGWREEDAFAHTTKHIVRFVPFVSQTSR